jgi:hypothetical protein
MLIVLICLLQECTLRIFCFYANFEGSEEKPDDFNEEIGREEEGEYEEEMIVQQ